MLRRFRLPNEGLNSVCFRTSGFVNIDFERWAIYFFIFALGRFDLNVANRNEACLYISLLSLEIRIVDYRRNVFILLEHYLNRASAARAIHVIILARHQS